MFRENFPHEAKIQHCAHKSASRKGHVASLTPIWGKWASREKFCLTPKRAKRVKLIHASTGCSCHMAAPDWLWISGMVGKT